MLNAQNGDGEKTIIYLTKFLYSHLARDIFHKSLCRN